MLPNMEHMFQSVYYLHTYTLLEYSLTELSLAEFSNVNCYNDLYVGLYS